jgi:uncharacterized protein (TIGR02996 family)
MPHTEDEQPQHFQRGRLVRLARRVLKLGVSSSTLEGLARASAERPADVVHHGAIADHLEENGDPRHMIVREALAAPRNAFGRVTDPNLYLMGNPSGTLNHPTSTKLYTPDGGWIQMFPASSQQKSMVRYIPHIRAWEDNLDGPDYTVQLPAEVVKEIHEHLLHIGSKPDPDRLPTGFSRRGKVLRLARRTLKLTRPARRDEIEPFTEKFAENPLDDAPHYVFADYLDEVGDPRAELVRQQLRRGRQNFGEGKFLWPKTSAPWHTYGAPSSMYDHDKAVVWPTETLGYVYLAPHRHDSQVLVAWVPQGYRDHASREYTGVVNPDTAHEIARNAGVTPEKLAEWPDHVKPKNVLNES